MFILGNDSTVKVKKGKLFFKELNKAIKYQFNSLNISKRISEQEVRAPGHKNHR